MTQALAETQEVKTKLRSRRETCVNAIRDNQNQTNDHTLEATKPETAKAIRNARRCMRRYQEILTMIDSLSDVLDPLYAKMLSCKHDQARQSEICEKHINALRSGDDPSISSQKDVGHSFDMLRITVEMRDTRMEKSRIVSDIKWEDLDVAKYQ
jgi:hypothetical protein